MKIAIYIRDIEIRIGGTESYFASLFETLQKLYFDSEFEIITSLVTPEQKLLPEELADKLNKSFGTDIKPKFEITHIPYKEYGIVSTMKGYSWYSKYTKKFDMCFDCTRNLMISKAKKNYSIIHFPLNPYINTNIVNKCFLLKPVAIYLDKKWKNSYDLFLCNSKYTASWLKKIWNVTDSIEILYPPVQLLENQNNKKKQIFVCSRIERTKSLHILIKAFLEMNLSEVTLVIAGAKLDEDEEYYQELLKLIENKKIEFRLNPTRNELRELYTSSLVFWHAKGLEVTEEDHPDLLEHFGITTVEAMSAGCIPIVINKGGQKEIVDEGINGFKWNNTNELIQKTLKVFQQANTSELQNQAIEKSKEYGIESFTKRLIQIMGVSDE